MPQLKLGDAPPPLSGPEGVVNITGKRRFGGFAHFPGTGPAGETCNSCRFAFDKETKPKCRKWRELMGGRAGGEASQPNIALNASACRYWEPNG